MSDRPSRDELLKAHPLPWHVENDGGPLGGTDYIVSANSTIVLDERGMRGMYEAALCELVNEHDAAGNRKE